MSRYAATIFLSAFLLFLVQPVIARQILPWFGGSAAVWATCLVFFQSVLLAGYAYADFLIRKLGPRRQLIVHSVMLVVSLAWLPIAPDAQWKPTADDDPTLVILGLLVATIGLPYLMLSTTSPLLQAWYWRHHETKVPYRLFALSNFASLLALLAYPVAIEPWIPNRGQTLGWSALYVVFVLLCGATGYASYRAAPHASRPRPEQSFDPNDRDTKLRPQQLLMWLLLSATGSCLLLAVTNHITQNIAAVPFLWVLPLSLYLITFILAFDHPRWYVRPVFLVLLALVVPTMGHMVDSHGLGIGVALYAAGLFIGCMFLHGELALTKPEPRHLTAFYLMMSVGGALGSLLIGVIAPLSLSGYYELGLVLILVAILASVRSWPMHLAIRLTAIVVAIVTVVVVAMATWRYSVDTRVMTRNFYGVIRTREYSDPAPYRTMYHGGIKHGGQLLGDGRRTASSYFGPTSGYGRLFASLPDDGPRKIGVIGLGAGALAVYGREGDTMVFYELDPQVVEVARSEFSFLDDMPGEVEVVVGDGRLALEREQPRHYDVLAIDAFSGDSIPMHLITREAMAAYVEHLEPDGAIVFQATNRYIDILPVVERLAAEHGMTAIHVADYPVVDENGPDYWLAATDQVIVTRNRALIEAAPIRSGGEPIPARPDFPVFTDDYTNLFKILK